MNTRSSETPRAGEAQHTAGPWRIADGMDHFYVVGPSGKAPARFVARIHDDEQGRTDARLIAAAPDLLAALVKIADYSERTAHTTHADFGRIARSAIAKATGEVEP